jgi:hypothetical protein
MNDPTAWSTQKHPDRDKIVQLASSELLSLMREIETQRARSVPEINTCQIA